MAYYNGSLKASLAPLSGVVRGDPWRWGGKRRSAFYTCNQKESIMHAGIFIALAAIAYARCDNPVVGSLLFSVGLLGCLTLDAPLCTGRANQPWYVLTHRKDARCVYTWWETFSLWWGLFAINGFFATWLGVLARLCIDTNANTIIEAKLSHPWYWMLFMGFLCGLLIQIGVHAYKHRHENWPVVVLCVMAFMLLGGEHCIANAAYIGMMTPSGDWGVALQCVKLLMLSAVGNLLAGAIFWGQR